MRRSFSLVLLAASPIWAQFAPAPAYSSGPSDQGYPQQPPPGYSQQQPSAPGSGNQQENRDWTTDQQHGVARIRLVQGDVNVKRGDNGTLTGAVMNAPMFAHDQLQTGPGSRAEIELDSFMALRLAPDTDLGFADLAFGKAQAQLGMGTAILRIAGNSPTQIELDTPSVALRPLTQGEYRVSVFDNGTTSITVRSGRLEMSGPRGSENVEQGQTVLVRGGANDPEFQRGAEIPRDQFDEWSTQRDAETMAAQPPQYVDSNVYGAEDLNRYGSWVPSQYGQVWAPQVAQDWSPYSNGEWVYGDYYGWTWVGYEPWGWAPYHYGRWFYNTGVGWCWWPGARHGLAFGFGWSPALVSFFGYGSGLGWITLAPFEVFHPWWGRGGFGAYGVFRGYDAQRFYRNAGIRGGAMTAGLNGFAGPGHRFAAASGGQLRGASIYHGSVPFSPTASSYRFSERTATPNPRFSQSGSRTFYSSRNGGGFTSARPGASPAMNNNRGGWQQFGSPASQRQSQGFYNGGVNTNRQAGGSESGWHSFGQGQAPRATTPNYGTPNYGGGYRAPSAPNYGGGYRAPQYNSAPTYRAPQYNSAPRYSAPQYRAPSSPAPHYSAPRSGGGGGSRPSGGGGHTSGGGGGHSGGGGHHR